MTLPNLPTDNLYKFLFLTGITLIISSVALFVTQYKVLDDKIYSIQLSMEQDESKSKFISKDLDQLDSSVKRIEELQTRIRFDSTPYIIDMEKFKSKIFSDKNYRDYLEFYYNHRSEIFPEIEQEKIVEIKREQIREKHRQLILNESVINARAHQAMRDWIYLVIILIICSVSLNRGIYMTRNGYKKWYELVQKPMDEKLKTELEQLKSSQQKTNT